jgi:flagellar biosynthesis GTPase FlhF
MDILVLTAYFVLGFLSGVGVVLAYGMYSLKKLEKKNKMLLKQAQQEQKTKESLVASIRDRLTKAHDITQKQFELLAELDMPSKNALHSKWKNGVSREVRQMEDDKISLLRSILADGFDPEIAILNESYQKEKIKLSDYIKKIDKSVGSETPPPPPPPDNSGTTLKKVGRFFVYSGGGSNSSGDSEEPNN